MKDFVVKAWNVFVEKLLEVVDDVNLVSEQIREAYNYPTSNRQKIVKVFSKCTCTDIQSCGKLAWKIKR